MWRKVTEKSGIFFPNTASDNIGFWSWSLWTPLMKAEPPGGRQSQIQTAALHLSSWHRLHLQPTVRCFAANLDIISPKGEKHMSPNAASSSHDRGWKTPRSSTQIKPMFIPCWVPAELDLWGPPSSSWRDMRALGSSCRYGIWMWNYQIFPPTPWSRYLYLYNVKSSRENHKVSLLNIFLVPRQISDKMRDPGSGKHLDNDLT